ncbi:MAG: Gfo/Idh/MocA family protein, partial [Bacteroidota bacterium]
MEKKNEKTKSGVSRRDFVKTTAFTAAGLTILPSGVISAKGRKAPSDKLNVAAIGIGGKGSGILGKIETENIVGLCDVDWKYSRRVFEKYPNAKKYKDFRKMYDDMNDSIDAVVVATADHTHAIVAAEAMLRGWHTYVEKPLTHSVYESRLLTKLTEKYKIATQMGNQGASGEGVNLITEWIANGE